MWIPQETIRAKRDGKLLQAEQIQAFVKGIADGSVSEGQIAAFAMATFFRGMDIEECRELTLAMRDTGDVMQWDLPGPVVDKHSTGGVGDMISLMLGPIVAACGAYVPMITGRGLGHTGGTLDKLESIPGYQAKPDNALFQRCVKELGICIIGQTQRLAPADQRFYATRDVTATVESVPLITASILSKKLAEGLNGLVMDVKVGNGAFMSDSDQATLLAKSIVAVANSAGVKTSAVLTDMNSPLAYTAGNALEIRETLDYLSGHRRHPDVHEVTMTLASAMLVNGGLAPDQASGLRQTEAALASGEAAAIFSKMVYQLGGPSDLFEHPDKYLPSAPIVAPVCARQSGTLTAYQTREVGLTVVSLGGGRRNAADAIDHRVGLSDILPVGTVIEPGMPLAMIHANSQADWDAAADQFQKALTLGDAGSTPQSRILTQL